MTTPRSTTDSFTAVEELERLRSEIVALDALPAPEADSNEFDDVAAHAKRVRSAAKHAEDNHRNATAEAVTQHKAMRAELVSGLQSSFERQQRQLWHELRRRSSAAAEHASRIDSERRSRQLRRRVRLALWGGPVLVGPAAAAAYIILGDAGPDFASAAISVVLALLWGGIATAIYRWLLKRGQHKALETSGVTPGAQPVEVSAPGNQPRPGVAAASSLLALCAVLVIMIAMPVIILGACFVIPAGIAFAAWWLFSDSQKPD